MYFTINIQYQLIFISTHPVTIPESSPWALLHLNGGLGAVVSGVTDLTPVLLGGSVFFRL